MQPSKEPSPPFRLSAVLERYLPLTILVVAALGAPTLIFSSDGLPRLRSLEKELEQVQRENEEQRRQIAFLRGEVGHLKDKPAAVERIARDELGLIRKNEVVFQFPKEK